MLTHVIYHTYVHFRIHAHAQSTPKRKSRPSPTDPQANQVKVIEFVIKIVDEFVTKLYIRVSCAIRPASSEDPPSSVRVCEQEHIRKIALMSKT